MTVMIDVAVRALILLALAWGLTALLRRQPASLRAFVWTVAFAGIIALPFLARLVPSWEVSVWQQPLRFEAPAPHIQPAPLIVPVAPASARTFVSPMTTGATAPFKVEPSRTVSPLWMLALVSLVFLARIAASHVRIARLLARASPAGGTWTSLVNDVRAQRGIRRRVSIRVSEAVNVPAIVGVFRPTLLLPADAAGWDADLRCAVVLHELAHVARWDALAQLVEQIACAVYWFIPLVWHGARRAAALRERASDDEVIRAGMSGPDYARRLLDLVTTAGAADTRLAALAMARPSRMRERVMAILDPVARREGLTMRKMMVAVVMSCGAVVAIAAAAPVPSASLILRRPDVVATADTRPPERRDAETAKAAQPQTRKVQTTLGPCGSDATTHQHMSGNRNGRATLSIRLEGGGCKVDLSSEGRLTFTSDFTDIANIDDRGFFRLEVIGNGMRRELDIESRGGTLTRTWRVDGREQPYDEAARRWFAAFLIDLDRRTAIGVDVRLPHLLQQGGVNAVLDETGMMSSDHARNVYYTRLIKSATLSSNDVARVLQQAAQLTHSDHYAHELIRAFAPRGLSEPAQRAGVTALIDSMESDHYIAESVDALVASGKPSGAEMDFMVRVLGRMKSDHYKTQVLTKVLTGATLTAEQQARLAQSAADIESDHYASEFLRRVIRARGAAAAVRQSFLESTRSIQSDHYRTETLAAMLEQSGLAEAELLQIVELAKPMSDHYESETLRKVARHSSANDRVRAAVVSSAEQLSRHYREEVLRSAGRDN